MEIRDNRIMSLPPCWNRLPVPPGGDLYGDPPDSGDPLRCWLFGLMPGETDYRVYDLPRITSFADIVRTFRVGSHGAMSYSFDEGETIELVAQKVAAVQGILPGRVILADQAGLKIRFERPVTECDYARIEALFPNEEMMQAGLEKYLDAWSGEEHPLASLLHDTTLHLWWD